MKRTRDYRKDLLADLQDPEEAAAYLNAALEAGDREAFLLALKNVIDARGGITRIARKTNFNRVSIYKMLAKNGNPGFENILRLLQTVGIRFRVVSPKNTNARPRAA